MNTPQDPAGSRLAPTPGSPILPTHKCCVCGALWRVNLERDTAEEMPEIHKDFTAIPAAGGIQRRARWFVRGIKPDGARWESAHKHETRELAEAEMDRWGPEMGDMQIIRETEFKPRR